VLCRLFGRQCPFASGVRPSYFLLAVTRAAENAIGVFSRDGPAKRSGGPTNVVVTVVGPDTLYYILCSVGGGCEAISAHRIRDVWGPVVCDGKLSQRWVLVPFQHRLQVKCFTIYIQLLLLLKTTTYILLGNVFRKNNTKKLQDRPSVLVGPVHTYEHQITNRLVYNALYNF
jgi:hypothetical protein